MRSRRLIIIGMIMLSGLLHISSGIGLMRLAGPSAHHHPIAIAVVESAKRKEPEKPKAPEVKPPPPPPKPKSEPKAPPIAPPPAEAPPPPAAPRRAAPVQTNIAMSNSDSSSAPSNGSGSGSGSGTGSGGSGGSGKAPPAVVAKQAPKPKAETPQEETCSEEPSKPAVANQPSLIEYTQQARADGIEGKMLLLVKVGADGAVIDVEVLKGVDPSLDAAAIAAVKSWSFKPALRCGKPVAGTYKISRTFELGD